MSSIVPTVESGEMDADTRDGRAGIYALLAMLLARPPSEHERRALAALAGDASATGAALAGLAAAARAHTAAEIGHEHFALFTGVGGGELLPYASYYLTGFMHERPLAEVRGDLARLGLAPAETLREPEDHMFFLCEVMATLARAPGPADDAAFFARHLAPWAARFFADLEAASAARFYRAVGTLGRMLMDVEQAAFALPN